MRVSPYILLFLGSAFLHFYVCGECETALNEDKVSCTANVSYFKWDVVDDAEVYRSPGTTPGTSWLLSRTDNSTCGKVEEEVHPGHGGNLTIEMRISNVSCDIQKVPFVIYGYDRPGRGTAPLPVFVNVSIGEGSSSSFSSSTASTNPSTEFSLHHNMFDNAVVVGVVAILVLVLCTSVLYPCLCSWVLAVPVAFGVFLPHCTYSYKRNRNPKVVVVSSVATESNSDSGVATESNKDSGGVPTLKKSEQVTILRRRPSMSVSRGKEEAASKDESADAVPPLIKPVHGECETKCVTGGEGQEQDSALTYMLESGVQPSDHDTSHTLLICVHHNAADVTYCSSTKVAADNFLPTDKIPN